ncbi:MAG: arginine--tRNA ligase [Desulfobacteraceae bacterium]|nr:arginine--tRNA ligase [Desulfobacteraceae bacterium]
MKQVVKTLIEKAAQAAFQDGALPSADFPEVEIASPKADNHGDLATNFALVMASVQKTAPRKIADAIVNYIDDPDRIIEKTEIAGPGFINFFIRATAWLPFLKEIHEKDMRYGASGFGKGERIQVEFVSSNPTGPLHVGHGRGAAVGDSMANILAFCGYEVEKEYYINDSGRQIQTLGKSVYLRLKELSGETIDFPEECYQGDYIGRLARSLFSDGEEVLPEDEAAAVEKCARLAAAQIIQGIREDLDGFGVTFDRWFSEQSLYDAGKVDAALVELKSRKIVYEKDGAIWFNSSAFGDEKDRVVVRRTGQTTYFASDIAYHLDKFHRGFDRLIDVWGADHHGYIPRMKASVEATGHDPDRFQVILYQLVNLLRDGQPVAMSTRAGEFVTLKNVIDEVGADAARFLFLTRHYESPLDFDLEVAKRKTNDNPVYYVQYVHARISSIVRKANEQSMGGIEWNEDAAAALNTPDDVHLIKLMMRYPEIVRNSAVYMEPHRITFFLMELAAAFHAYYNKHRVLTDDSTTTAGRLYLVTAVQKVIRNGLTLLGVSAPEKM